MQNYSFKTKVEITKNESDIIIRRLSKLSSNILACINDIITTENERIFAKLDNADLLHLFIFRFGHSVESFAKLIGVKSSSVYLWLDKMYKPQKISMQRIEDETGRMILKDNWR